MILRMVERLGAKLAWVEEWIENLKREKRRKPAKQHMVYFYIELVDNLNIVMRHLY